MLAEHETEILFEEQNSQLLGFTLKALPKLANTLTNPTPAQHIPQPNPTPFNLTPAIVLLSLSTPPPSIQCLIIHGVMSHHLLEITVLYFTLIYLT